MWASSSSDEEKIQDNSWYQNGPSSSSRPGASQAPPYEQWERPSDVYANCFSRSQQSSSQQQPSTSNNYPRNSNTACLPSCNMCSGQFYNNSDWAYWSTVSQPIGQNIYQSMPDRSASVRLTIIDDEGNEPESRRSASSWPTVDQFTATNVDWSMNNDFNQASSHIANQSMSWPTMNWDSGRQVETRTVMNQSTNRPDPGRPITNGSTSYQAISSQSMSWSIVNQPSTSSNFYEPAMDLGRQALARPTQPADTPDSNRHISNGSTSQASSPEALSGINFYKPLLNGFSSLQAMTRPIANQAINRQPEPTRPLAVRPLVKLTVQDIVRKPPRFKKKPNNTPRCSNKSAHLRSYDPGLYQIPDVKEKDPKWQKVETNNSITLVRKQPEKSSHKITFSTPEQRRLKEENLRDFPKAPAVLPLDPRKVFNPDFWQDPKPEELTNPPGPSEVTFESDDDDYPKSEASYEKSYEPEMESEPTSSAPTPAPFSSAYVSYKDFWGVDEEPPALTDNWDNDYQEGQKAVPTPIQNKKPSYEELESEIKEEDVQSSSSRPSTSGTNRSCADPKNPFSSQEYNWENEETRGEETASNVPAQSSSNIPIKQENNYESDTTEQYPPSTGDGSLSSEDEAKPTTLNPYEELDKSIEEEKLGRTASKKVLNKPQSKPRISFPPSYSSPALQAAKPELEPSFKKLEIQKLGSLKEKPKSVKSNQNGGSDWSTPVPIRHNLLLATPSELLCTPVDISARKTKRNDDNKLEVKKVEIKKKPKLNLAPEVLKYQYTLEEANNVFSIHYRNVKNKKEKHGNLKSPNAYRHTDAIRFASFTENWRDSWDKELPVLPDPSGLVIPLPESTPTDDIICAYYRVLAERDQKYILIACHVNVHGYHRGDLRFLEVNQRTELEGFPDYNVIGNLFLGDVVAVTELVRSSNSGRSSMRDTVREVSQDTPCYWMVARMSLQPRYQSMPVIFSFLKNRMAVVKGDDEPMRVIVEDWDTVHPDLIYLGIAFKPMKLENNFTEEFHKIEKSQIIGKASKIASYPNAFGTIFSFKECSEQNKDFAIGIDAFSEDSDLTKEEREKVVETCSLMGFSAANTIFNGRFDCRAFHMQDIRKSGQFVKFRIENPRYQPTLGLWNAGNKIIFGGPEGDVNATIETVIAEDNAYLRIDSRLSRDIPKDLNFYKGDWVVSQRELSDDYFLYDGYFTALAPDSNGRRIIETLYGGKPLELVNTPPAQHHQYYFPSVPEIITLNPYQNEYVQMLLDGNPLIIGSSPFGCGKSMTIITAALEIYKRNLARDVLVNQHQQLLITQSNYASVNLIEIAKRICSNADAHLQDLKFVRFVSDKNWNELEANCRTEYDMPYLMNALFTDWASGQIEESDPMLSRVKHHHLSNMLAYVLKKQLLKPEQLAGGGRRIYDKGGNFKTPFTNTINEAFFLMYQPDLIMTTADSSKNLLSVLKEVCTVQIDEASQLPEYTLLGLLKTFSRANFGLIGDINQLPPYCEDNLEGKLKEYGIGNTMERAIHGKLFPVSILRYVYRCHPKITNLLSELFYEGKLISGITEEQRSSFVNTRGDFWPNAKYPVMIINNEGKSMKMGTSTVNDSEKELVRKMVENLINHPRHPVHPRDIGVISFYAAQKSILTDYLKGTGVKCGTVDAFQGTEREIIIMCCTNDTVSEFMQLSNRLNVAMSRAKQATFIIGNLEGLRKAKYWETIVQRVEEHNNVVQSTGWQANPIPPLPKNFYQPINRQPQNRRPITPQRMPTPPQQQQPQQSPQQSRNNKKKAKKPQPQVQIDGNSELVKQIVRLRQQERMERVNQSPSGFQGKWDEFTYGYSRNQSS